MEKRIEGIRWEKRPRTEEVLKIYTVQKTLSVLPQAYISTNLVKRRTLGECLEKRSGLTLKHSRQWVQNVYKLLTKYRSQKSLN